LFASWLFASWLFDWGLLAANWDARIVADLKMPDRYSSYAGMQFNAGPKTVQKAARD
jgi:hypothetical protein